MEQLDQACMMAWQAKQEKEQRTRKIDEDTAHPFTGSSVCCNACHLYQPILLFSAPITRDKPDDHAIVSLLLSLSNHVCATNLAVDCIVENPK
mmetsp:Transcript_827/g.1063  ORF Transcript_827/g.1063 Transcript_827/m.1063 type:complete len:93 (+) Transcript_827:416-694(+)